MDFWDALYQLLGIRDFIYFIDSPSIQDQLFGVKLVFILFSVIFLILVFYLYSRSSYLHYHFLQDTREFLSWHAYGFREVDKRWRRIVGMLDSGQEAEAKLAVIEADDFLRQMMEEKGFAGESFDEIAANAADRRGFNLAAVTQAHQVRNSIVRETGYAMDPSTAKRLLIAYEEAVKAVVSGKTS